MHFENYMATSLVIICDTTTIYCMVKLQTLDPISFLAWVEPPHHSAPHTIVLNGFPACDWVVRDESMTPTSVSYDIKSSAIEPHHLLVIQSKAICAWKVREAVYLLI